MISECDHMLRFYIQTFTDCFQCGSFGNSLRKNLKKCISGARHINLFPFLRRDHFINFRNLIGTRRKYQLIRTGTFFFPLCGKFFHIRKFRSVMDDLAFLLDIAVTACYKPTVMPEDPKRHLIALRDLFIDTFHGIRKKILAADALTVL